MIEREREIGKMLMSKEEDKIKVAWSIYNKCIKEEQQQQQNTINTASVFGAQRSQHIIDDWRRDLNFFGNFPSDHCCTLTNCVLIHTVQTFNKKKTQFFQRKIQSCFDCKNSICKKKNIHPCYKCSKACLIEKIGGLKNTYGCCNSGFVHVCNDKNNHPAVINNSGDWICMMSGITVITPANLISEFASIEYIFDHNSQIIGPHNCHPELPYTTQKRKSSNCGGDDYEELKLNDKEQEQKIKELNENTLNRARKKRRKTNERQKKHRKKYNPYQKQWINSKSSKTNLASKQILRDESYFTGESPQTSILDDSEDDQDNDDDCWEYIPVIRKKLSDEIDNVFRVIFSREIREKIHEDNSKKIILVLEKQYFNYVRDCIKRDPPKKPSYIRLCEIIYNNEGKTRLISKELNITAKKSEIWKKLILKAWDKWAKTPTLATFGNRVNKLHFIYGMLFWMCKGFNKMKMNVIPKDEYLLKIFPPSRDLPRFNIQEKHMTAGRKLVCNTINSAADNYKNVFNICL